MYDYMLPRLLNNFLHQIWFNLWRMEHRKNKKRELKQLPFFSENIVVFASPAAKILDLCAHSRQSRF
ncbi:hypothetical protein AZI86_08950 [Bdellovibrio bacteriovorus]|uniref:Uncharacterized protein n=1 Tax=Bdellovibrio bacteriovorus TaxID=959 RepID=A0A150WRY3_BDEBC|nr:hypothetical protein AZI86_08950 [Bdellovibrio bacteriovorus]